MAGKYFVLEKRFKAVPPQLFTINGTVNGVITLGNTVDTCLLFKVKQRVIIHATGLQPLELEIKRIDAPHIIQVGPIPDGKPGVNTSIDARTDISAYTVALGAFVFANQQKRQDIDYGEFMRSVYEEEPTVAIRSTLVDPCGDRYTVDNPLPVRLGIPVTVNAELEVQLTHLDDDPDVGDIHDSIRIGDGVDLLAVEPDGSISVNIVSAPIIYNVPAPVANTEYSFTIPTNVKRFLLRIRSGDAKTHMAYVIGDTTIKYLTMRMGTVYEESNLGFAAPLTLYFQTNKNLQVMEILTWS